LSVVIGFAARSLASRRLRATRKARPIPAFAGKNGGHARQDLLDLGEADSSVQWGVRRTLRPGFTFFCPFSRPTGQTSPEDAIAPLDCPGQERDRTLKNIHLNWPKNDPEGAAAFAAEHGIK
jgi:hypothetical protein